MSSSITVSIAILLKHPAKGDSENQGRNNVKQSLYRPEQAQRVPGS